MNHREVIIFSADKGSKRERANLLGQLRFHGHLVWVDFIFLLHSLPPSLYPLACLTSTPVVS